MNNHGASAAAKKSFDWRGLKKDYEADDCTNGMSLGKMIRLYRRRCGLTQKELAERIGTTLVQVSRWENDIVCPRPAKLPKLAAALGCPVEEFFKEERG